jgi:hypothetical protein
MNNGIEDLRAELEYVFAEAKAEIALYPDPLNVRGLALLEPFNPLSGHGETNYISYLLPFWIREQVSVSLELCRDLAIGNLFAMLNFFLLDDAIDAGTQLNADQTRSSLVLGQLLNHSFYHRYNRYFPAGSALWSFYSRYLTEWAEAVSQEGNCPVDPYDARLLARKSSPVKLCAVGILMATNHQERMVSIEEAIDLTLATLQLADDWADWREDLEHENCSAFLTLARQSLSLDPAIPLDEPAVMQAIYHFGCLDRLAEIASDNGRRLIKISHVPKKLIVFHNGLADGIRKDSSLAEETTNQLALGGFSYFLSTFEKKYKT